MRTLDQMGLLEATQLARSMGYRIYVDWMDGCAGGEVQVGEERWICLDEMQSADEQLQVVLRVLRKELQLARPAESTPAIVRRAA